MHPDVYLLSRGRFVQAEPFVRREVSLPDEVVMLVIPMSTHRDEVIGAAC